MSDHQEVIDTYFATWNETDSERRRRLVEKAWSDQCRYVDPTADASGRDEIDGNLATVQAQFPGHQIRRTSGIDVHHNQARFEWELVDGADGTVVAGVDYAEFADDGRLRMVAGFFGPVPAEAG